MSAGSTRGVEVLPVDAGGDEVAGPRLDLLGHALGELVDEVAVVGAAAAREEDPHEPAVLPAELEDLDVVRVPVGDELGEAPAVEPTVDPEGGASPRQVASFATKPSTIWRKQSSLLSKCR